jgi:ubiquitin C-terminal hydrolase
MHQDAHEFLNWLLNAIAEILIQKRKLQEPPQLPDPLASVSSPSSASTHQTWVHELFEGILTNEIKCLNCETVTERKESFLDLSVDISENSSLTSCLRQFSSSEMLCMKNKFFCDACGALQEAEKRCGM